MASTTCVELNEDKVSAAKLLLEQRGSIPDAATPVATRRSRSTAIKEAAIARYNKFFGYAKNIFLGDSRENSSIQEHLDTGHPEMAGSEAATSTSPASSGGGRSTSRSSRAE